MKQEREREKSKEKEEEKEKVEKKQKKMKLFFCVLAFFCFKRRKSCFFFRPEEGNFC